MGNLSVISLPPSAGMDFPTFPFDINDDASIVGNEARLDSSYGQVPVGAVWQAASVNPLPLNGHILSVANAINRHGDVAGRWGGGVDVTVVPGSGMLRWKGAMVDLREYLRDNLGVYASECWG